MVGFVDNRKVKSWEAMLKIRLVFLAMVLLFLFAACSPNVPDAPQISVENSWARAAAALVPDSSMDSGSGSMQMGDATSAVYMLIRNAGRQPDRLIEVRTDLAAAAETHISTEQNGIMTMSRMEWIDVPAQGQAELKPGGMHIMLIDLNRDLIEGDTLDLILVFEESGELQVNVPIRNP